MGFIVGQLLGQDTREVENMALGAALLRRDWFHYLHTHLRGQNAIVMVSRDYINRNTAQFNPNLKSAPSRNGTRRP